MGIQINIVPFDADQHLEKLSRIVATTCKADKATVRKELLKLYFRLPIGFFVALANDGQTPVGFLSVGYQKPRELRYLLGVIGQAYPPAISPLVELFMALGVISQFEIANLVVDRMYQRKGIGRRLMEFGEQFVEEHFEQNQVWLYVREDNVPAFDLYKKMGYCVMDFFFLGSRRKLIMRKSFSDVETYPENAAAEHVQMSRDLRALSTPRTI